MRLTAPDGRADSVTATIRLTFGAANDARAAAAFRLVETGIHLDTSFGRAVMAGIIRHG